MPLNATLLSIYRGVYPPANPSVNTLWMSQSAQHMVVSDAHEDRLIVLSPFASGVETNLNQEPKVFYNTVLGNWGAYISGLSSQFYATAPTPRGPWTKFGATYVDGTQTTSATAVLGNGNGGFAGSCIHNRLYVEGTTLYISFPDQANSVYKIASAQMSAPQTFTTIGTIYTPIVSSGFAAANLGNSRIYLANGTYYLFFDYLVSGGGGYQMGVATGSTVSGTYSCLTSALPTLWPSFKSGVTSFGGSSGGGAMPFYENGLWIMYSHWGNALTSDIFRATSTDLVTWVQDNNNLPSNLPWIRRRLAEEVSQVADINIVQGPNEGYWAFWDCFNNVGSSASIACSPVQETLLRWDGAAWANVHQIPRPNRDEFFTYYYNYSSSVTIVNGEEALCNVSGGAITITLPRADPGSKCRVTNVSTSGVNAVTVVENAGDAITSGAGPTIANGLSLTFRCFVANAWVKSNS